MKYLISWTLILGLSALAFGQNASGNEALKLKLNEQGSHYFQLTFLNQTWVRWNQSNPGSLVMGLPNTSSFDIGLRRTRIQLIGQINDRTLLYFQFGQNNFNAMYQWNGNRKVAPFFHDALGEYRLGPKNTLKMGAGLSIITGLSRFSQPSIASIVSMDVPVFAQTTVDQIDQFSRKLSWYARGQIDHWDYRLVLSDPFPITSNGQASPALATYANFSSLGHHLQNAAYLMYQFFEQENHLTPYMNGTYYGSKRIFNLAGGFIRQSNAMWLKSNTGDTLYQDMRHWAFESFLDLPLGQHHAAISAYAGYFNTNYGNQYLRYNGLMNPANGLAANTKSLQGQGPSYGNALPMFGTGKVVYAQLAYLWPSNHADLSHRWLTYATATLANFQRIGHPNTTWNLGIKHLMDGNKSNISLDYQNRSLFSSQGDQMDLVGHRGALTLQYQVFL